MAEVRKVRCGVNGFGRVGRIVARCGFFDAELEVRADNTRAAAISGIKPDIRALIEYSKCDTESPHNHNR
jgi:glyceraldehyde-3-phosphate dehydrogenase/erythrose-4-phosphate dehydrogenase